MAKDVMLSRSLSRAQNLQTALAFNPPAGHILRTCPNCNFNIFHCPFTVLIRRFYVAANFDTRVIFSSFRGDGTPKQSSQPEEQALSIALDFLAETASGIPWRDAIDGILEMLVHDRGTIRCLPVALLDCRVASIRSYKFNELPEGLLAAFDAAIALLIAGESDYNDAQIEALLGPIIAHPEHPPQEGLEALLGHLEPQVSTGKASPAIRKILEELCAKFAEVDAATEIQKRLKDMLAEGAPVRKTTLNIKVAPKSRRQVRVEAPRPNEKWLRNVESLIDTMGEDRVRNMAKRAFCSYMTEEDPEATESLLGYAWISERLCDAELVEILAEIARRGLNDRASNGSYDLGLASVRSLSRQHCDHSREWLDWLLQQIDSEDIIDDVRELYSQQTESS
jgi:hypothetical protein